MRPLFAAALLLAATPIGARDLAVPPNKGWQHAETGLVLRASLDGLPRTKLTDSTDNERDVAAEFADADRATIATVYLFHPAIDDVAVWFDRSEVAIQARDLFGGAAPLAAPLPFAAPGGGPAPAALRRVYRPGKGPYLSTALAVAPLGDWLVAVRLSSRTLDPAALDDRLIRLIAAIGWPKDAPTAHATAPTADCPDALPSGKARTVKDAAPDILGLSLMAAVAHDPKAVAHQATPATWCRDAASTQDYGVYRAGADAKAYSIAIGDAGRAISVTPSIMTQLGQEKRWSVSYESVDGSTVGFPSFDGLPRPDQAVALVEHGRPTSRVTAGANRTVTISVAPRAN